jgi:hypothetical protein
MVAAEASETFRRVLVLENKLFTNETARDPTRKPETDKSGSSRSEIVLLAGGGAALLTDCLVSLTAIAATTTTAIANNAKTAFPCQLLCFKECTPHHHFLVPLEGAY